MAGIYSLPPPRSGSILQLYFHDVSETDTLTYEEEQEISRRVQEGDPGARDHLIRANLRLVVTISREFRESGVEMADLIAEGNLGLMRAVEAFDPERGTRFSTYACFWIRQSIQRYVNSMAKPVSIPSYMNAQMIKWERTKKALHFKLDRTPTFEEIAQALSIPAKRWPYIKRALRIHNSVTCSGQYCDHSGAGGSLVDDLVSEGANSAPSDAITLRDELNAVLRHLNTLDEREAMILRLRFGLDDAEPCTLAAIGNRLGITRERARQLELQALRHLAEKLNDDEVAA